MVFSVGVLFSLYALSPFAAEIPRFSFERNFDSRIYLTNQAVVDLKVNSFYFAGTGNKTIYLGNWTGPFHLIQARVPGLDTTSMDVSVKDLKIPDDYRVFRMSVDSPYFFLSHGTLPGIFKGSLNRLEAKPFVSNGSPFFVDAEPISPTRIALKSLMKGLKVNELAVFEVDSPYFEFKPNVLEQQVDGIFCVDGTLQYDRELNRLVYLYAYRNEYIIMDTSLNVINRFHTIDPFAKANIKVANVKSQNYTTLASPPMKTNVQTWVSGNHLFVQSPLMAKNQEKVDFLQSTTIDVYDITKGKYLYTFYLKKYKDNYASMFAVLGDRLLAIYDHYLVEYHLNLPNMDDTKLPI